MFSLHSCSAKTRSVATSTGSQRCCVSRPASAMRYGRTMARVSVARSRARSQHKRTSSLSVCRRFRKRFGAFDDCRTYSVMTASVAVMPVAAASPERLKKKPLMRTDSSGASFEPCDTWKRALASVSACASGTVSIVPPRPSRCMCSAPRRWRSMAERSKPERRYIESAPFTSICEACESLSKAIEAREAKAPGGAGCAATPTAAPAAGASPTSVGVDVPDSLGSIHTSEGRGGGRAGSSISASVRGVSSSVTSEATLDEPCRVRTRARLIFAGRWPGTAAEPVVAGIGRQTPSEGRCVAWCAVPPGVGGENCRSREGAVSGSVRGGAWAAAAGGGGDTGGDGGASDGAVEDDDVAAAEAVGAGAVAGLGAAPPPKRPATAAKKPATPSATGHGAASSAAAGGGASGGASGGSSVEAPARARQIRIGSGVSSPLSTAASARASGVSSGGAPSSAISAARLIHRSCAPTTSSPPVRVASVAASARRTPCALWRCMRPRWAACIFAAAARLLDSSSAAACATAAAFASAASAAAAAATAAAAAAAAAVAGVTARDEAAAGPAALLQQRARRVACSAKRGSSLLLSSWATSLECRACTSTKVAARKSERTSTACMAASGRMHSPSSCVAS